MEIDENEPVEKLVGDAGRFRTGRKEQSRAYNIMRTEQVESRSTVQIFSSFPHAFPWKLLLYYALHGHRG